MLAVLTTGALVDLDNVAFVIQAELNKWVIVPKKTVAPNLPVMDGHEKDELVKTLEDKGLVIVVKKLPRADAEKKLEVANK